MPRRIPAAVNVAGSDCSALAGASVSRGVTVVSDAPAVDDRAARLILEDVHARNGQQLFGFARRLGLTDDQAEEVVQEALLRLWRAVRGQTIDDPAAWTFRAAYRLAMDRHRGRRRWQAFLAAVRPTAIDARGRGEMIAGRDELLAVWSEVDRLPARQRHVVYLHYQADLTFETIGRVLDIQPSSARAHAARGLATLRERLAGDDA
jgi:RNA polymerase sigma factor (sigma-70 family)